MSHLRSLLPRHFHTLLNLPNPSQYLKNPLHIPSSPTHFKPSLIASIFVRPISLLAQFEAQSISLDDNRQDNTDSKKPLHVLFKEAVGLSERTEVVDIEKEVGTNEFKKRLSKLEEEVRRLQEISSSSTSSSDRGTLKNLKKVSKGDSNSNLKSLYSLFANNAGDSEIKSEDVECLGMEDPMVYKKLSPEMVVFVSHLYEKGYFSNANFLPRNKFDVACFENSYGRDFVKYAAEKFGKDYQEIAKWLSASELKNVALFGCPSLGRKNIFSAKRLRYFFGIQEDTVCSKCVFKTSCKFVNQSVWKGDDKNLNLAVVMRVITLYALESVPPQLVVPDDIKESVNQLLKEVVNLSTTTLA